METQLHIRELINRLARLDAASAWQGDLNPTQRAVLGYLGRANRFSKSPSHVAEYLGSTRGTISQTFKSLLQKGYVTEHRAAHDKRTIRFDLTPTGKAVANDGGGLEQTLAQMPASEQAGLQQTLEDTLKAMLVQNKGRAFGLCKTCIHHKAEEVGGFCTLLSEPLSPVEATQICVEQESAQA